jgi:hypothetical protein
MEKLSVFQVVVLVRGKEGRGDAPDLPDDLVTDTPVLVLAHDAQTAALRVAMGPECQSLSDAERQRVEVLARPF